MTTLAAARAQCAELVRRRDRTFYLASLLAPRAARADLLALAAYRIELERAVEAASEPNVGEIRLAWWRDRIEALAAGSREEGVPMLEALAVARAAHGLPPTALTAMAEAYRFHLYADAVATENDLEGLMGETYGAHIVLAARILDPRPYDALADAAGFGGLALGLSRLAAGFAEGRRRGRSLLPADLLGAHGLTPGDALARDVATPVLHHLAEQALVHYRKAQSLAADLPRTVRPAFLPLAVTPRLARRCLGSDDLASQGTAIDPLRAYAEVLRAAVRGLPATARA